MPKATLEIHASHASKVLPSNCIVIHLTGGNEYPFHADPRNPKGKREEGKKKKGEKRVVHYHPARRRFHSLKNRYMHGLPCRNHHDSPPKGAFQGVAILIFHS